MTTPEEASNSNNNTGNSSSESSETAKNKNFNDEREDSLNNSDSASSLSSDISSTSKNPLKRSLSTISNSDSRSLPKFTSNLPEGTLVAPSPRIPTSPVSSEFTAPKFPKVLSRPNSPSNAGRPIPPRSRIANIRRESDCSIDSEVAHERYFKTAAQVSTGFEEFSLDDKAEDRKRTKSLSDPISITILSTAFPCSSASPTRTNDVTKQCYSPSTHQLVRGNISYSPSPSPTPSSPKRSRIMRSMSPIVTRQISKRRYTNSGNVSGLDSDTEGPPLSMKRQCTSISKTSCGSPLVREAPSFPTQQDAQQFQRSTTPLSECSTTSSIQNIKPKFPIDPSLLSCITANNPIDSDDSVMESDNGVENDPQKDDQSSTAFSSRAVTPIDEQFSDASRIADDGLITTTPTGLIRSLQSASPRSIQSASPNLLNGRLPLPPSPLASQRLRDDF